MDNEAIINARRASMEQYLKGRGEILSKEGRQYRVEKHTGLVVSGNKWYNHTLSKGGNTLDYLVGIEGIDFKRAVEILSQGGMCIVRNEKSICNKSVEVPGRNENDKRVIAYLVRTRGIKAEIIMPLLKRDRIYESINTHNCVFTGIDETGRIRYVMQRSIVSGSTLKFESVGSDKRYSFSLEGESDTAYIFESPIDLLSYLSLKACNPGMKSHMLSLGGIADIALESYLNRTTGIRRLVLCLDNDKAGSEACRLLHKKYSAMGHGIYRHTPVLKDWNEELLSGIRMDNRIIAL